MLTLLYMTFDLLPSSYVRACDCHLVVKSEVKTCARFLQDDVAGCSNTFYLLLSDNYFFRSEFGLVYNDSGVYMFQVGRPAGESV